MRFSQGDDTAASRGILLGVVLGLALWLLVTVAAVVVLS